MKAALTMCAIALLAVTCDAEWFAARMESVKYPPLATQARLAGIVRLRVYVSTDGSVSRAEVVEGKSILAEAAIANVRKWRFAAPCGTNISNGTPIVMTYTFELEGATESRPRSHFRYEHPFQVHVTAEAQQWMPSSSRPHR